MLLKSIVIGSARGVLLAVHGLEACVHINICAHFTCIHSVKESSSPPIVLDRLTTLKDPYHSSASSLTLVGWLDIVIHDLSECWQPGAKPLMSFE